MIMTMSAKVARDALLVLLAQEQCQLANDSKHLANHPEWIQRVEALQNIIHRFNIRSDLQGDWDWQINQFMQLDPLNLHIALRSK